MNNSERSRNLKAQETPGKLIKFAFQHCRHVATEGVWEAGRELPGLPVGAVAIALTLWLVAVVATIITTTTQLNTSVNLRITGVFKEKFIQI